MGVFRGVISGRNCFQGWLSPVTLVLGITLANVDRSVNGRTNGRTDARTNAMLCRHPI